MWNICFLGMAAGSWVAPIGGSPIHSWKVWPSWCCTEIFWFCWVLPWILTLCSESQNTFLPFEVGHHHSKQAQWWIRVESYGLCIGSRLPVLKASKQHYEYVKLGVNFSFIFWYSTCSSPSLALVRVWGLITKLKINKISASHYRTKQANKKPILYSMFTKWSTKLFCKR